MSESATMNPLELWNESRRLAAVTYDIAEGNTEFEQGISDCPGLPFTSVGEVNTVVSGVTGETRADIVESLQHIINKRLKNTVTVTTGGVYDNRSVLEEWNTARSAATSLLTWRDTDPGDREPYDVVQSRHNDVFPGSEREVEELLEGLTGGSYNEQHMELTRVLYETLKQSAQSSTDSGTDEVVTAIASDLISVFIDREVSNYRDITDAYEDVEFPPRNLVMMEVMNMSGESQSEKKENIEEWVRTWYDDPSVVVDMRKQSPRPMGLGPRQH